MPVWDDLGPLRPPPPVEQAAAAHVQAHKELKEIGASKSRVPNKPPVSVEFTHDDEDEEDGDCAHLGPHDDVEGDRERKVHSADGDPREHGSFLLRLRTQDVKIPDAMND